MSLSVHVYGQCTLQGRYRDFTDFSEVYKRFKFSSDILSRGRAKISPEV